MNEGMNEGKVKWFDEERGYGFIRPFKRGDDVFVHIEDVKGAGYKTLGAGDLVEYNIHSGNDGKDRAIDIVKFEYVYEEE